MQPSLLRTAPLFSAALPLWMPTPCRADGALIPRDDPGVRRDMQEPAQKALIIYRDGKEDLILQVRYAGATQNFAWIVPTPARPQIGVCRRDLFHALSQFTRRSTSTGRAGHFSGAFGGPGGEGVRVLERKQVGYLDVSVLDAKDAHALIQWLHGNGYAVSPRLGSLLEDYLRRDWVFTALRIDLQKAGEDDPQKVKELLVAGDLEPLRLTFRAPAPVYPLKISSLNGGVTELLLYLITERPVQTPPGYRIEYQQQADAVTLTALTRGLPAFTSPMWLTRLSRRMSTSSMREDLTFLLHIARSGSAP